MDALLEFCCDAMNRRIAEILTKKNVTAVNAVQMGMGTYVQKSAKNQSSLRYSPASCTDSVSDLFVMDTFYRT